MTSDLSGHVKALCPQMSESQVRQTCSILRGELPLVKHGKLPKADFSLSPISSRDPRHKSLRELIVLLEELCRRNDYGAVASTQVGMVFPFVWFSRGDVLLQHPRFWRVGTGNVYALEGCGSLPKGNMYITQYPQEVRLEYSYFGQARVETHKVAPWFTATESALRFSVTNFMHETRHLHGKTAASGDLVDPKSLSDEDWRSFVEAVRTQLRPDFVVSLLAECGKDASSRRVFRAYLHRNPRASGLLLPGPFGRYRSVSFDKV